MEKKCIDETMQNPFRHPLGRAGQGQTGLVEPEAGPGRPKGFLLCATQLEASLAFIAFTAIGRLRIWQSLAALWSQRGMDWEETPQQGLHG